MVRGVVNYDSYMKCDCINARAITTIDLIEKKDDAPENASNSICIPQCLPWTPFRVPQSSLSAL